MRDDFSADTIRQLGDRVGLLCSRPDCRASTKGPHTSTDKATNLGRASHIRAAAKGGPRYDDAQTPEERSSIGNGIWLCATCSALVDSDPARFPPDVLRAWKVIAEHDAQQRIGKPAQPMPAPSMPSLALTLSYKRIVITQPIHRYELEVRLKNIGTKRIDDWYIEVEFPARLVSEPGTVIAIYVPRANENRMWLFRTQIGDATAGPARRPLRAGEEYAFGFPYRVDTDIFWENQRSDRPIFDEIAKVRAFVDGELAAEVQRPVRELQCF